MINSQTSYASVMMYWLEKKRKKIMPLASYGLFADTLVCRHRLETIKRVLIILPCNYSTTELTGNV